ncbi:unnamed protein product [Pocillopora meandrina]|uniref:Apple domain-containing protein n=1 Tax=Pocillopora meandrina TaxID=46732 RepID=A0AAU9XKJ0_9CNID|nr:unnamed protein product [Pocillopora meandrina]
MAVIHVKLAVFSFLFGLALTKTCDTLFGNPTQARNQDRIFAGKRISSEMIPAYVPDGIFTVTGCLDSCLRFHHCTSFDFMQSSKFNGKICKIYGGNQQNVRLTSKRDWIHFNMSSAFLRQCLDLCLRIKVCVSIDIKKQNTQRSCRVNRANPKYFIIENDDWTHINVSSRALEEILASAEDECKEKDTDEASFTLELSSQTPTAVSLDEYCKTKALTVDSCTQKKKQGNCSGVWEARILANGWCCVDPESSSQHCCCPIPQ